MVFVFPWLPLQLIFRPVAVEDNYRLNVVIFMLVKPLTQTYELVNHISTFNIETDRDENCPLKAEGIKLLSDSNKT